MTGLGAAPRHAFVSAIGQPLQPMCVSDFDIHYSAHLYIQLHGADAMTKARERVERMRKVGDVDGADTWLRMVVAIGKLAAPPARTRH